LHIVKITNHGIEKTIKCIFSPFSGFDACSFDSNDVVKKQSCLALHSMTIMCSSCQFQMLVVVIDNTVEFGSFTPPQKQ